MTRNKKTIARFISSTLTAAALAVAFPCAAQSEQPESKWSWSVTPYVWATDVGIDVSVDDQQVIDETITVQELMEDVKTIAQIRLEAQKGAHGFFVDLFDVNLTDDATTVSLPSGAGSATPDPEIGITIPDPARNSGPKTRPPGAPPPLRHPPLNERATIDAEIVPAGGESFTRELEVDDLYADALVGFRYIRPIGERVTLQLRADVSTGGTDLTWSVGPTVGYSFGETGRYTAIAGYRHMEVDFDTAGNVDATMTMSGFVAGLRIGF